MYENARKFEKFVGPAFKSLIDSGALDNIIQGGKNNGIKGAFKSAKESGVFDQVLDHGIKQIFGGNEAENVFQGAASFAKKLFKK